MELIDQKILKSAQSRIVSMGEFNFDNLAAPPLMSFLDMNDIASLETIATSIRYSGNPNKKKKAIQEIMVKRGFDKAYLSGTNRIVFKHYDNPNIVMKIAIDDIGRNDNPREFFNQNVLKPFVCKVFEVAGDGVVALTERVNPIKTREEFMSIADDVHKLLWILTQRYILADVGEKYYRNYGIRTGHSIVLLDYPYVFEPDEDMLVCSAKDAITGLPCGGLIDYDAGFNELVCTKCGTVYRASEIAKILKDKEIIIKAKGEGISKMKVSIVRNNKKVTVLDTTNAGVGEIKSSVENIKVPVSNPVNETPLTTTNTIKVNVNSTIKAAEAKANAESPAVKGKVSIKRTPVKNYNNGGYNKSRESFNKGHNNGDKSFKVNISRTKNNNGGRSYNTKKEHAPASKGAVAITAVNIEELKNTEFNFSSYDAENGLVFVSGRTPSGSDIKIHFNCKDTAEFIQELGIDIPKTEITTTDKQDFKDFANVVMELEQAKKDLLAVEAEKVTLELKNKELNELLSNVDELQKKIEELTDINVKKDVKIEELDAKIVELENTKTQEINSDINAKDEEILTLKAELEQKERTIESLGANLDERDASIISLNEELAKAKTLFPGKPEVDPGETDRLIMLNANLYEAKGFLSENDLQNYNGPDNILALRVSYTEDDGTLVDDFCIDGENKILCVSHINGTPIDSIVFNAEGNEDQQQQ